jgi:hypothetical protein
VTGLDFTTARCVVCGALTPEATTAFCGDACAASWTADTDAVVAAVAAEAAIAEAAERAVEHARRTGVWN